MKVYTDYKHSWATILDLYLKESALLIVLAVAGVVVHTIWSLIFSVICIVQTLKELSAYGNMLLDLKKTFEDSEGVKIDNIYKFLTAHHNISLVYEEGAPNEAEVS